MCFESNKPQISKVAEKDITVYKVMTLKSNCVLMSPYQGGYYHLREKYTAPRCTLKNEGGFYSFYNLKTCKKYKRSLGSFMYSLRIFKCIIPKGSRYIKGYQEVYFTPYKAIRSKKIIFKESVKNGR